MAKSIRDQIADQLGAERVTLTGLLVGGVTRDVTITREQASTVLAGGELLVDPITGVAAVTLVDDDDIDASAAYAAD